MLDALLDELYTTLKQREDYQYCVLHTKHTLKVVNKWYQKAGFVDCENYNRSDGLDRWMRLDLTRPRHHGLSVGSVSKL